MRFDRIFSGGLTPAQLKLIARGFNPFEYSLTKSYAKLRVRPYRRRPKAKK